MGQRGKKFTVTKKIREKVRDFLKFGITQEAICEYLEIDPKTLRKYFKNEIKHAAMDVIEKVGNVLLRKAEEGDTAACMFILKCKGGWKEKPEEIKQQLQLQKESVELLKSLNDKYKRDY